MEIKNYAPDGPEGQSREGDSAMCNAGLPLCATAFLIAASTEQGKYEEKERKKRDRKFGEAASV